MRLASPPQTEAKSLFSLTKASSYGTVPNLLQSSLVRNVICLSFNKSVFIQDIHSSSASDSRVWSQRPVKIKEKINYSLWSSLEKKLAYSVSLFRSYSSASQQQLKGFVSTDQAHQLWTSRPALKVLTRMMKKGVQIWANTYQVKHLILIEQSWFFHLEQTPYKDVDLE